MGEFNFLSIDRLVEFGASNMVASQMVSSMNCALNNMQIPGSNLPESLAKNPLPSVYYITYGGEPEGPFALAEAVRELLQCENKAFVKVWRPGLNDWQTATNIPELVACLAIRPPSVQAPEA